MQPIMRYFADTPFANRDKIVFTFTLFRMSENKKSRTDTFDTVDSSEIGICFMPICCIMNHMLTHVMPGPHAHTTGSLSSVR